MGAFRIIFSGVHRHLHTILSIKYNLEQCILTIGMHIILDIYVMPIKLLNIPIFCETRQTVKYKSIRIFSGNFLTIVRVLENLLYNAPNSKTKTKVYQLYMTATIPTYIKYDTLSNCCLFCQTLARVQPITRCKYEYKGMIT